MSFDFWIVAGLVVLAFTAKGILDELHSNISFVPILLLSLYIIKICVSEFLIVFNSLSGYVSDDLLSGGLNYFLKVSGICLVTHLLSEYAISEKNKILSAVLCILGRLWMLSCILPLVLEVLKML